MHVYVIERDESLVKIGISSNPTARARGIASQGGFGLSRIWMSAPTPDAKWLERAAHQDFADARGVGEWFSVGFDDAVSRVSDLFATGRQDQPVSQDSGISAIRKSRLLSLIESHANGKQAEFAEMVERTPAVIWQYASGHREMGEKFARHIEAKIGVAPGWMDRAIDQDAQRIESILSVLSGPQRDRAIQMLEAFAASCKAPH